MGSHASATSPRRTARANRAEALGEQLDVALLELRPAGSADEDQCPPGAAVGDEHAAELRAEPGRD